MIDFVVGAIIVLIVGLALLYIIKSKKKGIKCVGCPDAKNCCSGCCGGGCTGCSGHTNAK